MHSGTDQAVRRIAEQAGDVIVSVDLGGVISYASPALRTFGYAPDDVVGRTGLDLVHPDDRPRFIENTQALLRGELVDGANRQHRFRCADGRWAWIEGAPQLLHDAAGELVGFVNVLRDITARREQSDLFEVAFEKAAIGKALVGLDGRLLRVNQAFARMVGYAASELLELDFQSLTFPADLDADLERLRSLRAGDTDSYTLDKRYVRRDGACVWGRLSVSMVREPDGSPKHYIAQIQDLTDQRAAEAALRESEARHRQIAETTADIITLANLDGTLTFVSPSARQIGYEPDALVGSTFAANIHPDDIRPAWRSLKALMEGASCRRHRWRARHGQTGEWLWMESAPSLTRDPETGRPTGLIDVVRDISR